MDYVAQLGHRECVEYGKHTTGSCPTRLSGTTCGNRCDSHSAWLTLLLSGSVANSALPSFSRLFINIACLIAVWSKTHIYCERRHFYFPEPCKLEQENAMDHRIDELERELKPLISRELRWWTWKRVLLAAIVILVLLEIGTYAFNWTWT